MAVLERNLEKHLDLTPNALTVLKKRYLKKDLRGQITETPFDMFRRVAKTVAKADLFYNPGADVEAMEEKFYQIMANLEFMPNSPTLMNAGRVEPGVGPTWEFSGVTTFSKFKKQSLGKGSN